MEPAAGQVGVGYTVTVRVSLFIQQSGGLVISTCALIF